VIPIEFLRFLSDFPELFHQVKAIRSSCLYKIMSSRILWIVCNN